MNRLCCFLFAFTLGCTPAWANFTITQGSGTTIFGIDASNQGSSLCAGGTECPATVLIDGTGTPVGTSGNHLFTTATLNTTPTIANGNGVVPTQGGSALSVTNGIYANILQGNAVLSATNGSFSNIVINGGALTATNGLYSNILQGNAVLSATNPLYFQFSTAATLPAFAATPTVNLGTLNGAATQTTLASLLSAVGSPIQATGGVVGITWGGSTLAAATAPGTPQTSGLVPTFNVANTNPNGAAAPGGSSPVVAATMTHASTTALGTSLVAKAAAGNLGAFNCTGITGAAAGYCIVYNGTTAPSTGALTGANVLDACSFDTTTKGCSLTRLPNSIAASTGIVILMSSAVSPYTYTTGTDTGLIEADYF
jgi:hypothetical protein